MNFFKNLPSDVLSNIYSYDDTYKKIFTVQIIETKIFEIKHIAKSCKDTKAKIASNLYYNYMYDKERDTYYGYSYEIFDVDEEYDGSDMDDDDMCIQYGMFKSFTPDKKIFYSNCDGKQRQIRNAKYIRHICHHKCFNSKFN